MPAYDGVHFDPAAPVARVILRCPQTASQVADVQVLLDSGADVTGFRGRPRINLEPQRLLNNAVN